MQAARMRLCAWGFPRWYLVFAVMLCWIDGASRLGAREPKQAPRSVKRRDIGPAPADELRARFATLSKLIQQYRTNPQSRKRWETIAPQTFRRESLILAADRDPADVVLRRTGALLAHLKSMRGAPDLSPEQAQLKQLKAAGKSIPAEDRPRRNRLFEQVLALRRKIAFSNPLLNFASILFIKRHRLPGGTLRGDHMCDQFFGFHAVPGGGLFVLENAFGPRPTARNILADSVCKNGRFKGKKLLPGGFLSPELSFDARTIFFAYTEGKPTRYQWTENSTFHIFKAKADGSGLMQMTDGATNDFDPCVLPGGRIAFISERRGGYGRCHPRPVPLFTLHAMNADGSRIVRLSHHEGNEWHPSVDHNGMILYTRWDYVDRGNIQAHHPWLTTPDGRNARAVQGNFGKSKSARPTMEMDLRAIPGSRKYIATAAAHHSQAFGSLVLLDPRIPDDDAMAPLRRLTPEVPFPEAECSAGAAQAYATAWPLSEYFTLCVYDADASARQGSKNNYGIYLVDAFGNKELIYRDPAISCLGPIPLRPRAKPPVLSEVTGPKVAPGTSRQQTAPVGVVNVYNSLKPFPKGTTIKALRIIQVLPKSTPLINKPRIGYGNEKGARVVLGTVPVEADGSASFHLPVRKLVYFQVLDQDNLAVQSMRSATYVQPGQRLLCRGCHERHHRAPPQPKQLPAALRREPSTIRSEMDGADPFSFPRLVQPVLERHCVACHQKEPKAMDLRRGNWQANPNRQYTSYVNLRQFAFFYGVTQGQYDPWTIPRTTPGQFGARASKLYKILKKGHYKVKLPPGELHRITLWLDCNSDFFGSYENTEAQAKGKIVRPTLE